MSKLYGVLSADLSISDLTKRGSKEVSANLSSWNGSVNVVLTNDERVNITIDNLDVTINGSNMFKKQKEYDLDDTLVLIKEDFKKKVGSIKHFPHKKVKEFFDDLKDRISLLKVGGN